MLFLPFIMNFRKKRVKFDVGVHFKRFIFVLMYYWLFKSLTINLFLFKKKTIHFLFLYFIWRIYFIFNVSRETFIHRFCEFFKNLKIIINIYCGF